MARVTRLDEDTRLDEEFLVTRDAQNDAERLWSAILPNLGEMVEELSDRDSMISRRFKRGDDWLLALTLLRKLLDKHRAEKDERLPMRYCLHKWGTLRTILLPMLQRYYSER